MDELTITWRWYEWLNLSRLRCLRLSRETRRALVENEDGSSPEPWWIEIPADIQVPAWAWEHYGR